ncbi:hypothetical protein Micbo1qcDRAFT_193885 [Microdochium bolleyi]|uniref:Uncharacterized protein n=1 Tax=Microdochium bolleyi TaxID=196109 RepID=A0A136JCC8_9PEZI|nr:hypothetical protein Micbo1qcDRAFT_193885 [Microdochium bolleyi]
MPKTRSRSCVSRFHQGPSWSAVGAGGDAVAGSEDGSADEQAGILSESLQGCSVESGAVMVRLAAKGEDQRSGTWHAVPMRACSHWPRVACLKLPMPGDPLPAHDAPGALTGCCPVLLYGEGSAFGIAAASAAGSLLLLLDLLELLPLTSLSAMDFSTSSAAPARDTPREVPSAEAVFGRLRGIASRPIPTPGNGFLGSAYAH